MRDSQYGKVGREPLSAERICKLQILANNAEIEPNHPFVNDLGDGMRDLLDEVDRLRQILGNVEFYLRRSGLSQQCAPALLEQLEAFRI